MAQALLKPHVLQFLDFTTQKNVGLDVGLEQVRVEDACAFRDRSIAEMQIRREVGVIILAIRRSSGQMIFNPPAETKIESGDYLIAMGEPSGLHRLEQLLMGVLK